VKVRYLAFILVLALSVFLLAVPSLSIWSSPYQVFNATPNTLYLNWTNGYQRNVTIMSNGTSPSNTNVTIGILNATSSFIANYSQFNSPSTICQDLNTFLLVRLDNGTYANVTTSINGTAAYYNNATATLIHDVNTRSCSPGRYWIGNFTMQNLSSAENLNISIILDIPISANSTPTTNPLSNSTGVGTFGYAGSTKLTANSTYYHSYFFNATSSTDAYVRNATSVVINITGWVSSQNVDLFLFDSSGTLKSKSINVNTSEWLNYNYLPSANQMWEIRIYGNTTSTGGIPYYGYIVFGTLNATNADNTNQNVSLINFTSAFGAAMNVANSSLVNVTLKNEGGINMTNTIESKELYYVQRTGNSGGKNISIFVPDYLIASKLKVSLNWTGPSNYSFNVYRPNGTLAMNSMNKFAYANFTDAVQEEEYNETTDLGSGGYWTVQILNNSNNNAYNLTTYAYVVNASAWISSNYTTFNFNNFGLANSSDTIQYNLTVPTSAIDGKYEGFLKYRSDSGATLKVPLEVLVKTPSLVVNNTMSSSTVVINENIGSDITKALNITINNTGSFPLSFTHSNSSGILDLSSANKNITFTYILTSSPLSAGSGGTINITIPINTTLTGNTSGQYRGWILLSSNDSYPYQNFNLTLIVNLTSTLTVNFFGIQSYNGGIMTTNSSQENVTIGFNITYANGNALENPLWMNTNNFSVWLNNINSSSLSITYTVPSTGYLSTSNYSMAGSGAPVYCNSAWCDLLFGRNLYYLNMTIPASYAGGYYDVLVTPSYNRGDYTFTGTGDSYDQGKYLIINNSALYMSWTNSSWVTMYPTNTTRFYVNVTNFGPVASSSALNTINFTELCPDIYSITSGGIDGPTGCAATYASDADHTYNITIPANSSCIIWWSVRANDTGSGNGCSSNYIRGYGTWFNPLGISPTFLVYTVSSSTDTTTTTTGATNTPTTTNIEGMSFVVYQFLVAVQQNSTNSTDVRIQNTGNLTLNVSISINGINSTWYSINDTSSRLLYRNLFAGYRINFAVGSVEVGDYQGTYSVFTGDRRFNQSFILRILPAPATQVEINNTLLQYKLNMTDLENQINQSKQGNMNVTLAEQRLAELKSKITQAENYIKAGDYFSANMLFTDIKNLINQTKTELATASEIGKQESRKQMFIYIGIGAAVLLIGAAAYLFWPTKGSSKMMFKSLKPKEPKEKDFDKLKEKYKDDE
jgi:hypothetical protein